MTLTLSIADAELFSAALVPDPKRLTDEAQRKEVDAWIETFRNIWTTTTPAKGTGPSVTVQIERDHYEALHWLARRSSSGWFGVAYVLGLADIAVGVLSDPGWVIERSVSTGGSVKWARGVEDLLRQVGDEVPYEAEFGKPRNFPMSQERGDFDEQPMWSCSVDFVSDHAQRIEAAFRTFEWGPWTEADPMEDEIWYSDVQLWLNSLAPSVQLRFEPCNEDVRPLVWMAQRALCDADAAIFIGLQRFAWEPIHMWDHEAPFPGTISERGEDGG